MSRPLSSAETDPPFRFPVDTMLSVSRLLISLAALLPLFPFEAHGAEDTVMPAKPQYSIKEDEPAVGTRIRHEQMTGSNVALNLPYELLPERDKAALHAEWENIPPGDEPPFPTKGLIALMDPLRRAQQKLGEQGPLFAVATVGADGQVTNVNVYKTPGEQMTRMVSQLFMLTPFKPAMCSGQPCQMDFPLRVNFSVHHR